MKAKSNIHRHQVSSLVFIVVIHRSPIKLTDSRCWSTPGLQNLSLIRGVESRMQDYTEINPPMEIKAAGHNTLFGTAQGILLVVVRDTQDVCRTIKLPIVLVTGLGRNIFSTTLAAQKGVKTIFTKAGFIIDLGLFSIQLTRSDNLDHLNLLV